MYFFARQRRIDDLYFYYIISTPDLKDLSYLVDVYRTPLLSWRISELLIENKWPMTSRTRLTISTSGVTPELLRVIRAISWVRSYYEAGAAQVKVRLDHKQSWAATAAEQRTAHSHHEEEEVETSSCGEESSFSLWIQQHHQCFCKSRKSIESLQKDDLTISLCIRKTIRFSL